jgi:hypothetical protein
MQRYWPTALMPTALALCLAVNHLVLGGHLAVDALVIGCALLYYYYHPLTRN